MKQKSTFVGLVAILSLTMALSPALIDNASALKSEGNPLLKHSPQTNYIVCGDILCSEVEDNSARQVQEKTVKIEGLDVFYLEAGSQDAPTVLLLHGFPT